MSFPEKELQKKWKAIRDNFVKDVRHQRKASTGLSAVKKRHYIYFDQLQFLLPCLNDEHEPITENETESCDLKTNSTADERVQFNVVAIAPPTATAIGKYQNTDTNTYTPARTSNNVPNNQVNVIKCRKEDNSNSTIETVANALSEMVSWHHEERLNDKFGNRAFLLSFLPLMDELTADLVLEARFKITEIFRNICCANQTMRQATECLNEGLLPNATVQYSPSSIISYEDPNREN